MRSAALGALVVLVTLAPLAGCGRFGGGARSAEMGSFRAVGAGANVDPTLRPARLLPETVDETATYGVEPGGGVRAITAGLRVVSAPRGGILAADERLPQPPVATTALPERLGGGFLFVVGNQIWRADRWLGPAKPIFTAPQSVSAIVPGLDRVYLRSQNSVVAIDGRRGAVLDLGPWPASPHVSSYAAADGWRAAAIADLRGAVATFDAGATWRSLELPLDPKQVVASGDNLAVGGFEGTSPRVEAWYELRPDGSSARLAGPPREVKGKLVDRERPSGPIRLTLSYGGSGVTLTPAASTRGAPERPEPSPAARTDSEQEDLAARTFGKRPLATAVEDGWPLTDGTAVIARDGALARVRLADGVLTELVRDAFPLKPARCHPITLTRPSRAGAFGFVCGEPRAATVVYAYDPLRGRLVELRRFDKPRVVTSSGNGAIAVRGACAPEADAPAAPMPERTKLREPDESKAKTEPEPAPLSSSKPGAPAATVHPYCILGLDDTWREIHVRGDVGGERVVVLSDGRLVVLSPPEGEGASPRLTILDKGRATTLPIQFPRVTAEVARLLRLGLWLDGFEERRPGVVGGWIEANGVMLGVEIGLDGKATPGPYIRDAGAPFVSGRYGLGWSSARRGYETTDGGMTWTTIDVPDPLQAKEKIERRACGPIGCLAAGWIRVGWGEPKREPPPQGPEVYRGTFTGTVPQVQLACEPMSPLAPTPPLGHSRTPPPGVRFEGHSPFSFGGGPPVLGSFGSMQDLPPFLHQAGPALRDPDRGSYFDAQDAIERYASFGLIARVYAWGPKTGEWETLGRWQVKWLSPFAGWPELHSSLPVVPPAPLVDATRQGSTSWSGARGESTVAPGDDAAHALLVFKRIGRADPVPFELEADRAPVEIRRADGEPFGEIDAEARAAGRWYLATGGSGAPFTVVWQVEGAVARELARVPRAPLEASTSSSTLGHPVRLARRSDGRAVGLVVDGQPTADRSTATVRWVLPIDLETGALGEPESLGYTDLAGRTLEACTDEMVGWVVDAPILGASVRVRTPVGSGSLGSVVGRLRLTNARSCAERIAGTYDGGSSDRTSQLVRSGPARPGPLRPGEVTLTAASGQNRYALRCSISQK
jgi:hypothetical protein